MTNPNHHGSFANTFIWALTLLAIAALTVWKFEIWPVIDFATNTGTQGEADNSAKDIPVEPITIAKSGANGKSPSAGAAGKGDSPDVPPPAELARLDLAEPLPPIPQPDSADWQAEPGSAAAGEPSNSTTPKAAPTLPTGADFGGNGLFPDANEPPTPAPEQQDAAQSEMDTSRPPTTTEETEKDKADAGSASVNPFIETVAATSRTKAAGPVGDIRLASMRHRGTAEGDLKAIDADIAAGRDLAAHRALSQIYWDEPDRRGEIAERIQKSADRIYFDPDTHYMPAHKTAAQETLEIIAGRYNIPPAYLARLNDLTRPVTLRADQELKVVKGPFGAVVDHSGKALILHAHGYFVGRYPAEVEIENTPADGRLFVQAESAGTIVLGGPPSSEKTDSAAPSNPFAADAPGGTIRLKGEGAAIAADLLTTGAEVRVKE